MPELQQHDEDSQQTEHVVNNHSWDELMGGDLMMKIINPGIIFPEGIRDPDLVGIGNLDQGEMNDYLVIAYDGYYANKRSPLEECVSHDDEESMHEIFSLKDPSPHGYTRFIHVEEVLIALGNGDVPQGLELAVRFLSRGQCAIVRCHSKYAHPHGRKNSCLDSHGHDLDLPPSTNVIYRVLLKSVISSTDHQTHDFRLKYATQLKNIGNDYFVNEWKGPQGGFGKSKAIKAYNHAMKEITSLLNDIPETDERKSTMMALLVDCWNNVSAVYLRDREYVKAKEAATEAIQLDPRNLKALKRAAKAALFSCSFEECDAALAVAMDVAEDDAELFKLKMEYDKRLKAYQKKEKEMYARMIHGNKGQGKRKKVGTISTRHEESTSTLENMTIDGSNQEEDPVNPNENSISDYSEEKTHDWNAENTSDSTSSIETRVRTTFSIWFYILVLVGLLLMVLCALMQVAPFEGTKKEKIEL